MKATNAASVGFGLLGTYFIVRSLPVIATLPFLVLREDLGPSQTRLPFVAVLGPLLGTLVTIVSGGVLLAMRRRLALRLVGPETPESTASTAGGVTEALAFSVLGTYFAVSGGATLVGHAATGLWHRNAREIFSNPFTVSAIVEFV